MHLKIIKHDFIVISSCMFFALFLRKYLSETLNASLVTSVFPPFVYIKCND